MYTIRKLKIQAHIACCHLFGHSKFNDVPNMFINLAVLQKHSEVNNVTTMIYRVQYYYIVLLQCITFSTKPFFFVYCRCVAFWSLEIPEGRVNTVSPWVIFPSNVLLHGRQLSFSRQWRERYPKLSVPFSCQKWSTPPWREGKNPVQHLCVARNVVLLIITMSTSLQEKWKNLIVPIMWASIQMHTS